MINPLRIRAVTDVIGLNRQVEAINNLIKVRGRDIAPILGDNDVTLHVGVNDVVVYIRNSMGHVVENLGSARQTALELVNKALETIAATGKKVEDAFVNKEETSAFVANLPETKMSKAVLALPVQEGEVIETHVPLAFRRANAAYTQAERQESRHILDKQV